MERHILTGYKMSPALTGASSTLLKEAGRELGNMERLRSAAIVHRSLAPDIEAFVFPKLRPYAPGPGFDNMILVAKEGGTVRGIEDMTPQDVSKLLGMSDRMLSVYESNTDQNNLLAREIIAINYHATPVDEKAFDRKLYAQSLRDLHLHVVGFRSKDIEELPLVDKDLMAKDHYNELREPLSFLIERFVAIPSIQRRLTQGLTLLTDICPSQYAGISFHTETQDLTNPLLSQDLIQLHHNLAAVYQEVLQLFADPDRLDETGMPTLHEASVREQKIQAFFQTLASDPKPFDNASLMHTFLRLSRLMKSGTEVQALPPERKTDTPIFLRGLAYTLAIIRDPKTKDLLVTVSPRILSTGNLLATLGYYKVTGEAPPEDWVAIKQKNERAIAQALA